MSTAATSLSAPAPPRRFSRRRFVELAGHAYVWLILLVFVLPFLTLLGYSLTGPGGTYAVQNFQYVLGSFGDNLRQSFLVA